MAHINDQVVLVVDPRDPRFGQLARLTGAYNDAGSFDVRFRDEDASHRYSDGFDSGERCPIHIFLRSRTYDASDGRRRSTYTDLETTYVSLNLGTEADLAQAYLHLFGVAPPAPDEK